MNITHHTHPQGSTEWLDCRRGLVTASVASDLLTAKLDIADNATSRALIRKLAMERATGLAEPSVESYDMHRGHMFEPLAKEYYTRATGNVVEPCGLFLRRFDDGLPTAFALGASPDGLVGEDGIVEVKTRALKYQFETILRGEVPNEYAVQIQTQLLVTGRKWCDFISFCPGLPLFVKRVSHIAAIQQIIQDAVQKAEQSIEAVQVEYLAASQGLPATDWINENPDLENTTLS